MVAPFRLDSLRDAGAPAAAAPNGAATPCTRTGAAAAGRRRVLLARAAPARGRRGRRLRRRPAEHAGPAPAVTPVLARTVARPGPAGHAPVADDGAGGHRRPVHRRRRGVGPEQPVPVASLTKLMTAYVVLHDHPLALEPAGPDHHGQPGRRRRLRQRHRRRRLQRAGDARRAADRAAGARRPARALGRQLRRPARPLGRREHPGLRGEDERRRRPAWAWCQSHFADASGVDPGSVSTASDLLKVAAPDMANPVVRVHGEDAVRHAARGGDDLHLHAAARAARGSSA